MEAPLFIDKNEVPKKSQDYEFLRAEGIKFVQELTGAYWTDYNEHDPGVTILEQLCYALTDLSYRTDFDIQDHLYDEKNKDHAFLQPNEILPCNALTVNDYRKLIFDSIFSINNVWVVPMRPDVHSINGLYKILLDIDSNIKDQEEKEKIIHQTKDIFCNNRNICEDIEEVKILDPMMMSVHADVEVDGIQDIETILAEIFFRVDEYLSPEIRFYSLEELLTEGYGLDDIFNGPLLKHGFIKSEELFPKPRVILISEVTKIIMQVKGVVSVKNLYLKVGDRVYDNQVDIDEAKIPKLMTKIEAEDQNHAIQFIRGTVTYSSIDTKIVKRKLNEFKSANKRVYRLSEESVELTKGKPINVENYYSIQNQFPVIYGIGKYGVPKSPTVKRESQAKQLKGYLMIFEQVIANYLSQLAHAKDLFSLKKNVEQTYFYQGLDAIPNVDELYKKGSDEYIQDDMLQDNNIPANYRQGLPALVKANDKFVGRRNRFLDYLLAVHGESFAEYSLSQFNHYFDEEGFELQLIQSKVRLLNSLSTINRNRARAFNYRKVSIGTDNITGMEARIAILMGLGVSGTGGGVKTYLAHSLLEHYGKFGLNLKHESVAAQQRREWVKQGDISKINLSEEEILQKFDFVDDEEVDLSTIDEEAKEKLMKATLPFRSKTILTDFLRKGMNLINYRIGQVKDGQYHIVYHEQNEERQSWLSIASFDDYKDAVVAVLSLVTFLKQLNVQSEGLHIIEHTLLRPLKEDRRFGFYLKDANGHNFFRSTGLYSFEDRQRAIRLIEPEIREYNNYSVERRDDGDFEVHFKAKGGKVHLVSLAFRESVEQTHEKMEQLYRFLSDADDIIPYEDKVGLYVQNSEDSSRLPEEFYSFRITVLFPSWTDRFHDEEFRSIINDTVDTHRPANIASKSFWMNPREMEEFEKLYYEWMQEKMKNGDSGEKGDSLRIQLSEYLFDLYDIVG